MHSIMWINQKTLELNTYQHDVRENQCKKRSYQRNQIFSGVFCVVGFIIIFVLMICTAYSVKRETAIPIKIPFKERYTPRIKLCLVKLSNINTKDVKQKAEEKFLELNKPYCGDTIELEIEGLWSDNKYLQENWLNTDMFKIKDLLVVGKQISDVHPRAFRGTAFTSVEKFELRKIDILNFSSDILADMNLISSLVFNECNIPHFESNPLAPIANKLTTLQIQCHESKLYPENIFGNVFMSKLATIDFSENANSIELNSYSFQNINKCQSLYLINSEITSIGPGTFAKIDDLKQVYLQNNRLKTIQQSVFGKRQDVALHLKNNPWNCTCELDWLKEANIQDETYCVDPPEVADELLNQAEFCDGSENSTTTTTTTTTTTKVPESSPDVTTITPAPTIDSTPTSTIDTTPTSTIDTTSAPTIDTGTTPISTSPTTTSEATTTEAIKTTTPEEEFKTCNIQDIPQQSVEFSVESYGPGSALVKVLSKNTSNVTLTYFGNYEKILYEETKCVFTKSNEIPIRNMNPDETYSICLSLEGESKISPFNCRSHEVEKSWDKKAWLTNGHMAITFSILGAGLFLFLILGAIIVFCLVRRNPALLKGSKRIVIVKHKETDAIVMPPNFVNKSERPKHPEFILKRRPTLLKNGNVTRPSIKRSVSETSIVSGSYISAVEPTSLQLLNWRLERLRSRMEPSLPPTLNRPSTPSEFFNDYESLACMTEV